MMVETGRRVGRGRESMGVGRGTLVVVIIVIVLYSNHYPLPDYHHHCHPPTLSCRQCDMHCQCPYSCPGVGGVVNIPIYSPFSSLFIYSLNYFPDIFLIYLFKAYYLEVTDIFLHFSIKNTLYLLGTCSNASRTCSDILGNSLFRQAASKALYSAQISACRLNHYLT